MLEESKETKETKDQITQALNKDFAEFRKLTGALKDVIKKKQELLKSGAGPEQIISNRKEALYYQVRIRETFRELHQVRYTQIVYREEKSANPRRKSQFRDNF